MGPDELRLVDSVPADVEAEAAARAGGTRVDLEAAADGDPVLGWSTGESNSRLPLRAAYYEAPARPALTSFGARLTGGRVRLDAELSGRGRVLVQVRRWAAPGRYRLTADTGGRDEAASTRTVTLPVA